MDYEGIENKFGILFEKLNCTTYIIDNYYAEGLINKLSTKDDPEIAYIEKLSKLQELVVKSFDNIENLHLTVQVFIIRLYSIISKNETQFLKITTESIQNKLQNVFLSLNSKDQEVKPSLKVAYMELALSLVSHDSGTKWLVKCGAWKNILQLSNDKQTVFVVRQIYKFSGLFLWKLEDLGDETTITIAVELIISPLINIDFMNKDAITSEEEEEYSKVLEPMLHIFLSAFNDCSRLHQPTILMATFKHFKVINQLFVLNNHVHRKELTVLCAKAIFWISVVKCFNMQQTSNENDAADFNDVTITYFNLLQFAVKRRCLVTILDYCDAFNEIWIRAWKGRKAPTFKNNQGEQVLIQQKLIFLQLVPILVYIHKRGNVTEQVCDESLEAYITKLLNNSCEHTSRAAYAIRNLMFELDPLAITLQSVKRLSSLNYRLNSDQANLIFQGLFYIILQEECDSDKKEEEFYDECQEKYQVLAYVMDTILVLVKNYDINWQQSIEVICLYTIVSNILNRRNLSCKFVVTALNVLSETIKKFLPPNLSLLLEAKPGSAIHELGKLMYGKMQDINWEVRDTALELLLVCTKLAYIKFPPFQKQILENNLINLAATIAQNDFQPYVQASALKCLAAATKVNGLWEHLKLEHPNILENMLHILRNSQEGIVRKEAVNVLCEVYQNIKLPNTFKKTLYDHMVSVALTDFHWEVQIGALEFWTVVIQSHLTEQGMLDGTFPQVTFSKESRKIVTLNNTEIQKRLIKAFEELSSIGCITVITKLLADTDPDIIEAAYKVPKDLIANLNNYKVLDILKPDDTNLDNLVKDLFEELEDVKVEEDVKEDQKSAEEILDGIVNCDDINLLTNIYENQMTMNNESKLQPKIKLVKFVTPSAFLAFINSRNFEKDIAEKRHWKDGIKSLSSLLDDVLGIYEINEDINSMDCY